MRTQVAIGIIVLVLAIGGFVLVSDRSANPVEQEIHFAMQLTSSAFEHEGTIPSKYSCDENRTLNPPLSVSSVPKGAVSLVLLVDDPDIPQHFKDERGIDSFDHWTVFNIAPDTTDIEEGVEAPGVVGVNGRGENGYTGPCPPPEFEPTEHRYIFTLFALDTELSLGEDATKADVEQAMQGHVLEVTTLIGRYDRSVRN